VSRLWLWGPVLVMMAIIFTASSIPNLQHLPGNISDKTGHGIGYGMLGALLLRALAGGRRAGVTWRTVLLAVACATAYGVSDEFHQRFVPGRSSDVYDVLADAEGATAASLGAWAILKSVPQPQRRESP
jgi:VanZ family protein